MQQDLLLSAIPIELVAAPIAVLEACDGVLWVRSASPCMLMVVGLSGAGQQTFGFVPASGDLEAELAPFAQNQGQVTLAVVGHGTPRAARGTFTLRRHGDLFVGAWTARQNDWRFEQIVQESPDVIAIIDRKYRHTFVNEAIRAVSGLGPEAFERKTHAELGLPPELVERFQSVYEHVFQTGQEGRKDFEFTMPNGEVRSFSSRVVPLVGPDGSFDSLLSSARDVTERKQEEESRLAIERKLQETQRLESLGLLAGGAAHDFNNLLTGIMGMTSLVQGRLTANHTAQPLLAKILLSCERAASLCAQMLAYAQLHHVAMEAVEVGGMVGLASDLVRVSMPKNVRLNVQDVPGLHVSADAPQVQQVLLNLMLNAVEALPEQTGQVNVTTFAATYQDIDLEHAIILPEERLAPLVGIRIADNGVGMDAATVARIFEPFFTTKFTGRGLGLSATLGIVRSHGGGLTVRSEVGRGSEFTLYLMAAEAPEAVLSAQQSQAAKHNGCVLLVDDEPSVRDSTGEILRYAGYDVIVASSGNEALHLFDHAPQRSQMVLLDLTMPGLDGLQTLAELRKRDANLPIVLMSGYAEHNVRERAAVDPSIDFLQKPFREHQLLAMCKRVAERGESQQGS